ncbi:MAG: PAS domain S-box protein [Phycisphaerae bacterium]|jgi:PAS domain S-box-containing protein
MSGTTETRDAGTHELDSLRARVKRLERTEARLRQSCGLLHRIINGMREGVMVLDRDLTIREVNDCFLRQHGGSRETLIGRKCHEVNYQRGVICAGASQACMAQQVLNTERAACASHVHFDGDGEESVVELYAFPLFDGNGAVDSIVELSRDVAEHERIETTLREKQDLLTSIIEGTDEVVFAKDVLGRYILINHADARGFGKSVEDILGLTDRDLFPAPLADQIAETDQQVIASGRPLVYEQEFNSGAGPSPTYLVRKYPRLDGDGRIIGVLGVARDITERKRSEAALSASEARYRTLFEAASDAIIMARREGAEVVFTDCNLRAPAMFGCSREELIGKSPCDFSPPIQPDGRCSKESAAEKIEGAVVGERRLFEWRHRRADGTLFDTEVTLTHIDLPDGPYVFAIVREITERKKAEEELRLAQFSVEHSAVGTLWVGPDARVLRVNEAFCRSLGYSRDELLQMSISDFDLDYPAETWPDRWARLKRAGSLTVESRHRRKNGEVFPVEIAANYLEFQGQEYNVAFILDITERKRAEQERRNLEAQIQHTQKLESLGVLAGGIAHDFNNLLMGVLGNAHLAREMLPAESPLFEFLEEIETAANRAADLTRQMLAYSGRGKFVVERVDLAEVVEELTDLLEVSISKKVELRYRFAPGVPAVEADVTQLRQVVMNLVINAAEAIGNNRGTITVSTGIVDMDEAGAASGSPAGQYAYLSVADDGCGMDGETEAKLFEPFFTTKFTGRGLGLAAVQGIVRGHRGGIHVDSDLGTGTTFRVSLPACAGERATPTTERGAAPPPRGTGTVLVVDDEVLALSVAQKGLESCGYTVLRARDGREALDVFRAKHDAIDLVLLDLTMPHLSGAEVFEEMRRMTDDLRVIVTSGYDEQDATSRISGQGYVGFIQKPYPPRKLVELVASILVGD